MIYEEREKYSCDVCGNVPDDDGMIEHGRGCYVVNEDGGGITHVEFKHSPVAVRWSSTSHEVPNRNDTRFIASGGIFPRTDIEWMSYLTTVRDLMRAGF